MPLSREQNAVIFPCKMARYFAVWYSASCYMPEAHLPEVFPVVPIVHVKEVGASAPLPASGTGPGSAVAPAAGSASPVWTRAALPPSAFTGQPHLTAAG